MTSEIVKQYEDRIQCGVIADPSALIIVCFYVLCCRILRGRRGIEPSPQPIIGVPWASSSCMMSPTKNLSKQFKTG